MNPMESREDWTAEAPNVSSIPTDPVLGLMGDCVGRVVGCVLESARVRVEVDDVAVRTTVIVPVGGRELCVTIAASLASMGASRAPGALRLSFTDLRTSKLERRAARSGALEQAADRIRALKRTKGADDAALSYDEAIEQAARVVEKIAP